MMAAGLLAKKAVEKGLKFASRGSKRAWRPARRSMTDYLNDAGLTPYLEQLSLHLVGYGCTTSIGNSGASKGGIYRRTIADGNLVVAAVLSGNRNFEGRVHPEVRANYLASPPLVVAYGMAGRMDVDLKTEPLGTGKDGKPVYLKDVWPTQQESRGGRQVGALGHVHERIRRSVQGRRALAIAAGHRGRPVPVERQITYIKQAPYFEGMKPKPDRVQDVKGARVLAVLGDRSTTNQHFAGRLEQGGPAGKYLMANGVGAAGLQLLRLTPRQP